MGEHAEGWSSSVGGTLKSVGAQGLAWVLVQVDGGWES